MKNEIAVLILTHLFPNGFKHLLNNSSPNQLLDQVPQWKNIRGWEEDLKEVENKKISIIPFNSPLYPNALLKLPDFPSLLYVQGTFLPQDSQGAAVIGTRNASLYGKEMGENFGKGLASAGITVISGLARGIDTAAHEGALQGGRTCAVLGSGLSNLYPKENQKLAEKIMGQGAIISEYPMKTPPFKAHFPKRNRIVSALSKAIVLIESPLKGGGMLTMRLGEKEGKPLFALPGRADMPSFEGNHWWIKSKKATLIGQPTDLFPLFETKKSFAQNSIEPSLSEEEKKFLSLLPPEEKSIDELVLLTQLPVMKLNILLVRLVLKKAMKEFPGKIYKKIH